jgi:hypothetical protein
MVYRIATYGFQVIWVHEDLLLVYVPAEVALHESRVVDLRLVHESLQSVWVASRLAVVVPPGQGIEVAGLEMGEWLVF